MLKNRASSRFSEFFGILLDLFTGFTQFVYINRQRSLFDTLASLVSSFLKTIGLIREPVVVDILTPQIGSGSSTQLVTSVFKGAVPMNSSSCYATIQNSTFGTIANNISMTTSGKGYYSYDFNSSAVAAPYYASVACLVNDSSGNTTYYLDSQPILSRPITVADIFEGTPSVEMFQTNLISGVPGQILAQVKIGSNSVTNAVCKLTVYNSTLGKYLDNVTMSYSGDDGVYNYTWSSPPFDIYTVASRVSCSGGSLSTFTVQDTQTIGIQDQYAQMRMIS